MYHNVLAQTSQNNIHQQQQQQQQSNNHQQPMQSQQYYCYPPNQQGPYSQNQYVQPYQQEPYVLNQQQQQPIPRTMLGNLGQPLGQTSYNFPSIMQSHPIGYGSVLPSAPPQLPPPPHVLDQIRAYVGTPGPIFILPNNCSNPSAQSSPIPTNQPSPTLGCPGIGINCPAGGYPYPPQIPLFNTFPNRAQSNPMESGNCGCCSKKNPMDMETSGFVNSPYNPMANEPGEHRCSSGPDGTICERKNCPSAINLQALTSQLLGLQGIISCAATRLVLRKVPGSNVTTTIEDTIERAKRSLDALTKEQLLAETRIARQVNALLNLHITANPPLNVIPILTTVQLKVNLLKSHVDSAINRRLSESQGVEGDGNLDNVALATKSNQELRDLLGTLRQKECDERVNLNYAPYQSQRLIAENRLANVRRKIGQVEEEMDRRRGNNVPSSRVAQQFSDPGCAAWYGYTGDVQNPPVFGSSYATSTRTNLTHESPDPFRGIQVKSPKRLNLRPHVGSPETTYDESQRINSTGRDAKKTESDEEDWEENGKISTRRLDETETRCCNCDKSSEDESADEAKKKLGVEIHEGRKLVARSVDDDAIWRTKRGLSILKLSPNVLIVIDETEYRGGNKNRTTEREVSRDIAERENSIEVENREIEGTPEVEAFNRDKDESKPISVAVGSTKRIGWSKKKDKALDRYSENEEDPVAVGSTKRIEWSKKKDKALDRYSENEEDPIAVDSTKRIEWSKKKANALDRYSENEEDPIAVDSTKRIEWSKKKDKALDRYSENEEDPVAVGSTKRIEWSKKKDKALDRYSENEEDPVAVGSTKRIGWSKKKDKALDRYSENEEDPVAVGSTKRIEWSKKKDKALDRYSENEEDPIASSRSRLEESTSEPRSLAPETIDYSRENEGPEPLREQTVRMITKIQYEPMVFRDFRDNDHSIGKEKMIEERYKNSFAEDSLKSESTESTLDGDFTPESVSLRIENRQVSGESEDSMKKFEKESLVDEPAKNNENPRSFGEKEIENIDEREETTESNKRRDNSSDNPKVESRNELIFGALTTIGNHVASFGSIIGKIAELKIYRTESSREILRSERENEEAGEGTSRGPARENETRKEIGRWKYIRFSDVDESTRGLNGNENSDSRNKIYTLPRIKHSVIEDKSNGGKYVVTEETSKRMINRELGEPYKTGRSLVIRSRLKNPRENSGERSNPFEIVRVPQRRDKGCLALSFINVKQLGKNRANNGNELKSSDKFWLRPDKRDARDDIVATNTPQGCTKDDPESENPNRPVEARKTSDSTGDIVAEERVVHIHNYSKVQVNRT